MTTLENTFTDLEKQVLRNYLPHQCAYDFGQYPMSVQDIGNEVWKAENVNLDNNTIKGVVGSLVKKEILNCESIDRGSSLIYLDERFYGNEALLNETIDSVK
jgi:predicted transcriptional regulator